MIRWVHAVSRTQFLRHVELGGVGINTNDAFRLGHDGALDHAQANAAQPENGDAGAGFHLGCIQHRADARGDAATQQADLVQGRSGIDLGNGDFRQHRIFGKRGRAHIVMQHSPVVGEAGGPVGHQTLALGHADGLAQVGLAGRAEIALAAFRRVQRNHMVAGRQPFHLAAHLFHDGATFMSQDGRKQALRVGAG